MKSEQLLFPADSEYNLFAELKQRIEPYLKIAERRILFKTWIKIILFPALYIGGYMLMITSAQTMGQLLAYYAAMGVLMPLCIANVVHDALHGCLLKSRSANQFLRHIFDAMGGNSYVWQQRHVIFHHPNPNVLDWDIDLESRKIYTLSPADQHKPIHRFQHLYMPFVFPLFTLHWVLFRDFKDYYDSSSVFRKKVNVPMNEFIKLPLFKAFYLSYIILLPILVLDFTWLQVLFAFALLHVVCAIGTLIILLPNHWDEHAEFYEPRLTGNQLRDSWAIHQLRNTNDYAIHNPFTNFLMGGLNHHVAHHLFPSINHNYLPGITEEIIKITKEKNLPYKCFSLIGALRSHFRLLRKNGLTYGHTEMHF
jgi:linoleoyl-CoA desaturase